MTDQQAVERPEPDFDLYDPEAQKVMSWTLQQVGDFLGARSWDGGDGSESVEGDVACEIGNILEAAGLMTPAGDHLTAERYAPILAQARQSPASEGVEPVAWQYRWRPTKRSKPGEWSEPQRVRRSVEDRTGFEEGTLYLSPQPQGGGDLVELIERCKLQAESLVSDAPIYPDPMTISGWLAEALTMLSAPSPVSVEEIDPRDLFAAIEAGCFVTDDNRHALVIDPAKVKAALLARVATNQGASK